MTRAPTAAANAYTTTSDIVALLAKTVGAEKSCDVVQGAVALLGFEHNELDPAQTRLLLDTIANVPGLVGAAARFARRRLASPTSSQAPTPSSRQFSLRASHAEEKPASTPSPTAVALASPPPPPKMPPGERRPRSELVALLAHSLGMEKSDELVATAARRLHLDASAFNRDEALRVLEDLMKLPGIVGITARFAKARCVLRFPSA
jgi:hypothetical protein